MPMLRRRRRPRKPPPKFHRITGVEQDRQCRPLAIIIVGKLDRVTPGMLLDKIEHESAVKCVARRVRPIDIAAFWETEIHSQRYRQEDKDIRPPVKGGGPPTFHIQAKQAAAESQTHTSLFSTSMAIKRTCRRQHLTSGATHSSGE